MFERERTLYADLYGYARQLVADLPDTASACIEQLQTAFSASPRLVVLRSPFERLSTVNSCA